MLPETPRWRDGRAYGVLAEPAREMRTVPTPQEDALWQAVRRNQLGVKIRRQHVIGPYIADFYCASHHLVVEVDGAIHKARSEHDEVRDNFFSTLGFSVLRFTNSEVEADPSGVVARIAEFVAADGAALSGVPDHPLLAKERAIASQTQGGEDRENHGVS